MKKLIFGALIASCMTAPQAAQQLPQDHFKVIGLTSTIPAAIYDEKPFWNKTLPEDSDGRLTADLTPIEQLGLDDKSMLRLLKMGVMDFAGIDITRMAGDDPRFEACDLAGILPEVNKARKACSAYKEVLSEKLDKNWNAKLLAIGASTPQVIWCRQNITSLRQLKGKKVRVFNQTLRDFITGLGATSVSIAFSEVVPALNNGVVDCAVTGSLSGNTAGFPEVTKSVFMLPLGWSFNAVVANKTRWNSLPKQTREFLVKEFATYEDKMWGTLHKGKDQAALCNSGKDGCTLGKPVHMIVNEPTDEDLHLAREIVANHVLPGWAKRCGAQCVRKWNDTMGKVIDLSINPD
ncbi:MAG: TRAP transporter substrate-binding protein [Polaromonas sp.]|nr:TRAP transporter substrate-binding protein [Polaromonas sp.]